MIYSPVPVMGEGEEGKADGPQGGNMEKVERKKRRDRPAGTKWLLLLIPLALLLLIGGILVYREEGRVKFTPRTFRDGTIVSRETDEVARIAVTLPNGSWSAVQSMPGVLTEESGFTLSAFYSATYLQAAAVVGYEDRFTEDEADYAERLEEFGLTENAVRVEITYTDGETLGFAIGDRSTEADVSYYYMIADTEPGLFGVSVSMAEDWRRDPQALREFTQLSLQSSRIDRIEITDLQSGGERVWALSGSITDADASDTWEVCSPFRYPADGTEMIAFLQAIGNLRFGSLAGDAETVRKQTPGLEEKRTELRFHLQEGMGTVTGEDGQVETTVFPEEECILTVWGEKNEQVLYVQSGEEMYLMSLLTLGPVMEKRPEDTVSRYPVQVEISDLRRLIISDNASGTQTEYVITRENADTEDEEERVSVTENGVDLPYATFSARYLPLEMVTVSGRIPEGYEISGDAHTEYTFEKTDGTVHTIRLYPFDQMHDAVQVDDYPVLFYLIRGGLQLDG
ncbi:MAG: DUF4340 domain-containing protein [Clostridia bacterium]|nr:DUF4340 domain-containing protein [Clostridia bacterium]